MHHLVIYTLGSSSQPLHVNVEEDQYNLLLTRDVRWLKAFQADGGKVLRIRTNAIVFFLEPTEKHE